MASPQARFWLEWDFPCLVPQRSCGTPAASRARLLPTKCSERGDPFYVNPPVPTFENAVRIDVPFVASRANGVGVVQQRLQLASGINFLHFDFVPSLDGG